MSSKLPSREQAIQLLRKNGCPLKVISHCEEVAAVALEIATKLQKKGISVDLKLVEAGALLHDIGRSKSNSVDHGVIGAKITENEEMPKPLTNIVKRHVGGGITGKEAQLLGWSEDIYMPVTLEEKIVSYADKITDQSKIVPIDVEIARLNAHGFKEAAGRVRKLHEEINSLLSS